METGSTSPPFGAPPASHSFQQTSPLEQHSRRSFGAGRRSRTFSFSSQKSGNSGKKINLVETHEEKESKRLKTTTNPNIAMEEAEPSAVAAQAKSSLPGLRNLQHKDALGNLISDPDLSNPTRSRWERPLDTIRSFEAAIDGGYNRKSVYMRSDNDSIADWNRRSSYYAGKLPSRTQRQQSTPAQARNPGNGSGRAQGSYYGSRPQSMFRPESQYDVRQSGMWQQRDSYYEQPQPGSSHGYNNGASPMPPQHGGRRGHPRNGSEPHINTQRSDPNVYPLPNNHRSYETVASASGSGSYGEPVGYQTDPTSSDNSSIERRQSPAKREPQNDYGIGFSQNNEYQPSAFTLGANKSVPNGRPTNSYPTNGSHETPPPVPQKGGAILRKPTTNNPNNAPQQRPDPPEKRKSWFTRRFSKNSD